MKLWAKITIGIQTLMVLFFASYSYVKANEASTFLNLLREQEALLVRAELEAEKQTEMVISAQAAAQHSADEAQMQAERSRQAIEECENSK